MPEASVSRTWIGIEAMAESVSGDLISGLMGFLIKHYKKIGSEHVIEGVNLAARVAFSIDVSIDPILDVLQIPLITCSPIDEVLAEKIKSTRVCPASEGLGIW